MSLQFCNGGVVIRSDNRLVSSAIVLAFVIFFVAGRYLEMGSAMALPFRFSDNGAMDIFGVVFLVSIFCISACSILLSTTIFFTAGSMLTSVKFADFVVLEACEYKIANMDNIRVEARRFGGRNRQTLFRLFLDYDLEKICIATCNNKDDMDILFEFVTRGAIK